MTLFIVKFATILLLSQVAPLLPVNTSEKITLNFTVFYRAFKCTIIQCTAK